MSFSPAIFDSPLVLLSLKATVVLAATGAFAIGIRRARASARHLVWLIACCSLVLLPALTLILPEWHAAVLTRVERPVAMNARVNAQDLADQRPSTRLAVPSERTQAKSLNAIITAVNGLFGRSTWATLLWILWAAGIVLICTRTALALLALRRLRRESSLAPDGPLRQLFHFCVHLSGLPSNSVTLRMAQGFVGVPMTWGVVRPMVLLPASATEWSEDRLRMIFLHELAHVQRRDWLGIMISRLACALFWFHPLAWHAARKLRLESERAADDQVIARGVKPGAYSRELFAIVQNFQPQIYANVDKQRTMNPAISSTETQAAMLAALPMAQPSTIESRISSLLDRNRSRSGLTRLNVFAAISVGALAIVPLATIQLVSPENATAAEVSGLDLATPEGAVGSFIAAINKGDPRAAAGCVVRGRAEAPNPDLAKFINAAALQIFPGKITAEVTVSEASVSVGAGQLTEATGGVREDKTAAKKTSEFDEHRLTLRREGGAWEIVPRDVAAADEANNRRPVELLASLLAAPDEKVTRVRSTATLKVCLNNLRQIALAAHMYAQQHGDRFDFAAADAKKTLLSYVDNNEKLFRCAAEGDKGPEFAFNAKLANAAVGNVSNPTKTVLFYEIGAQAQELNFAHAGRGLVAFVDGHVATVSTDEAAQLRWEP